MDWGGGRKKKKKKNAALPPVRRARGQQQTTGANAHRCSLLAPRSGPDPGWPCVLYVCRSLPPSLGGLLHVSVCMYVTVSIYEDRFLVPLPIRSRAAGDI